MVAEKPSLFIYWMLMILSELEDLEFTVIRLCKERKVDQVNF